MEPVTTAALIGAGAGAATGTLSGLFKPSLKRQWKYKQKEMALTQQYALEQLAKQGEINYANWQKQFDYENAYNDPSKLFERYRAAGINPSAVLGNSGVAVQGTMTPPGAGVNSVSGPTGSPLDFQNPMSGISSAASLGIDAAAAQSSIDRNQAAADRDSAEADKLRGDTHSREWRRDMDDFLLSLQQIQNLDASAIQRLHDAQARIFDNDAQLAELTFGYNLESAIASTATLKEQYTQIRKYNSEFMDAEYASSIALNYARIYEATQSGNLSQAQTALTNVTRRDAQEWFKVNWETPVEVARYNEKGEVTGTIMMTGREIQSELLSMELPQVDLKTGNLRWDLRTEKNRLGYDVLRAFAAGAGGVAGAYLTKGATLKSQPSGYSEYRESYNGKGRSVGGTRVERRFMYGD